MRMKRYLLAATLVAAFVLPAISQTAGTGTRIKSGASVPGTCLDSSGNTEVFIKTGTGPYWCNGGTYAAVGGGGSGTVTTTGSPASGNLTKFSGATSITNADLSGDVTTSGTPATTVVKVDGVAYPASPSTDTVPVITAANTATYKAVADCQDSTGNHLNYTASTHSFSCGTSSSGSGGTVTNIATSSPITGGPITGTGTIAINDAAADGSTKGAASFTAADFNASLGLISLDYTNGQAADASHKGFLTSTDWSTFNGKQAAIAGNTLSAHNFASSINSAGTIAGAQPAISDLQSIAADAVVQNASGSSATPTAVAIPTCSSDGAHALVYSTSSHGWTCATISGGGGAATQPIVSKSANYTIQSSDFSALDAFIFTCTSSCDATLPSSAPSTNGQFVTIKNNGTGSLFVMPNGLTLDAQAAPVVVPAGYSVEIVTDASNYFSKNMAAHSQFASRRRSQVVATGSSTILVVGTAVSATHGGALTSNAATSTEGQFENSATSATLNNCADDVEVGGMWGIASTASNVRWSGRFGIDDGAAGVTSIRMFVGLTDTASTVAQYCGASATDAPTQNAIVFRCSSNVPDSNWMAVVSKSTGATAVSTGVACNTSNHTFAIQEHGGATAYFYIDGVMKICIGTDTGCTSASSKYPSFAAARMFSGIQTLTNVARNLHFFWMETESDH